MNAGDGKHADEVERDGGPHGKPARAHPDDAEAAEVEENEGHDSHPVDAITFGTHFFSATGAVVRVDPLGHGGGQTAE